MQRIPKFIRTDKVRLKNGNGQPMFIEKFKTISRLDKLPKLYTGLIICYWFESEQVKKDIFHEDDLELIQE